MSVHEYSLKLTKLLKYALSLISDPRDEMSRFVKGVSNDFQEECHLYMLHDNMEILSSYGARKAYGVGKV